MEWLKLIAFGVVTFIVFCIMVEKINNLEHKVKGLENLVEYHSSNYYELLDENFALKEQLQKEIK